MDTLLEYLTNYFMDHLEVLLSPSEYDATREEIVKDISFILEGYGVDEDAQPDF